MGMNPLEVRRRVLMDQPHKETQTADIVSFKTTVPQTLPVDIAIEPVQDLHWQSSPYPAGGGTNLMNPSVFLAGIQGSSTGNNVTVSGYDITFPNGSGNVASDTADRVKMFEGLFAENTQYTIFVSSTSTSKPLITVYYTDGTSTSLTSTQYNSTIKKHILVTASGKTVDYLRMNRDSTASITFYTDQSGIFLGSVDASSYAPYSNICPITGWTGANVSRTGVNIWDEEWEVGGYSTSTGEKGIDPSRIRCKNKILCKPNTLYYNGSPQTVIYLFYDCNDNYIDYLGVVSNHDFTTPQNAHYIAFYVASAYGTTYNNDISINYPSTDTAYHAYQGQTYSITFPSEAGTVYGGTLDVTTGVLTVDRVNIVLNGNESYWSNPTTGTGYVQFTAWLSSSVYFDSTTSMNDTFPMINLSDRGTKTGLVSYSADNGYRFALLDSMGIETLNEWKSWLSTNNVQLVLKLKTPVSYNLSPVEITTLLGQNNIFADCGDVTATYWTRKG